MPRWRPPNPPPPLEFLRSSMSGLIPPGVHCMFLALQFFGQQKGTTVFARMRTDVVLDAARPPLRGGLGCLRNSSQSIGHGSLAVGALPGRALRNPCCASRRVPGENPAPAASTGSPSASRGMPRPSRRRARSSSPPAVHVGVRPIVKARANSGAGCCGRRSVVAPPSSSQLAQICDQCVAFLRLRDAVEVNAVR